MARIRLFHATKESSALSILEAGFRDATGSYMCVGIELTGVFVSAKPVGFCEGAKGDVVIEVVIDSTPETLFYEWELLEAEKPYREFCIPAAVLNAGRRRRLSDDEVTAIEEDHDGDLWNDYPPGEPDRTLAELCGDD